MNEGRASHGCVRPAGPGSLAAGPGSLAAVNLDNDDVAALLGGALPAELGYPLVRIPVTNGSGEVVYLTPQLDELTGTYDRTFVSARALVREDARVDACITGNPPTCSTALPREPRQEDRVISQPLPALTSSASFVALRVVDAQSGAVVLCDECRPGEARLDPGRSYEVQVVATSLDFLLPTSVDPGRMARFQVGPSDHRKRLVGVVDEVEHVYCAEPDEAAGLCRGHQVFDLYQALTEARIDIQSLRVSARTAPSPSLPPRTAAPLGQRSRSHLLGPALDLLPDFEMPQGDLGRSEELTSRRLRGYERDGFKILGTRVADRAPNFGYLAADGAAAVLSARHVSADHEAAQGRWRGGGLLPARRERVGRGARVRGARLRNAAGGSRPI